MKGVLGLLALGLTGCVALPVGEAVPVADLSAAARGCGRGPVLPEYRFSVPPGLPAATRAVVEQARVEWRAWGSQIVDFRAIDHARTRAVRELANDSAAGPYPVLASAGCWENDPRLFARLRDYWRPLYGATLPAEAISQRLRDRYEDDLRDSALAATVARPASWTVPWSAAFISYVVTTVGRDYLEAGAFAYGETHDSYVGAAVAEGKTESAVLRYAARPVGSFAPRAGDIVCSYRSQPRRPAWSPDSQDWRLGPAHCDIVVAAETRDREGRLFVIGGNVLQAVTLGIHALDATGRLIDSVFRNWAVVLADRGNPVGFGG